MDNKRWIIVSNRLPIRYDQKNKRFTVASGGLVSSLLGVAYRKPILWFGLTTENYPPEIVAEITKKFNRRIEIRPLTISKELYNPYYNNFCNAVLWPLLHYETERVAWDLSSWQKYQEVNRIVANALATQTSAKTDLLWIHDFHLMLVASYLRAKRPRQGMGFFLHVPFPNYEIFRQLQFRSTILSALLAHDLVGFHDYSYLMHFAQTVRHILGVGSNFNRIHTKGRTVSLGVYPVSIPTANINRTAKSKRVKKIYDEYRQQFDNKKLILGVDRLDYIKGIDLKLDIFNAFLTNHQQHRGHVSLLQVVVPSRTEVPAYRQLKETIEGKVGHLNGTWGKADYVPVYYIFNSVQFSELLALYQLSDCLLISSKRDGMNLVALEYVAAQTAAHPGQVLLSEFTGAISTMPNAIAINPWHINKTAACLNRALSEDRETIAKRNREMLEYLKSYTGNEWAKSFISDLCLARQSEQSVQVINVSKSQPLLTTIANHQQRVLFLDFDGTLVPIQANPKQATIDGKLLNLLASLKQANYQIVIISGRDRKFLWQQFSGQSFTVVAEHGAEFYDPQKKSWRSLVISGQDSWLPSALQMMRYYQKRVPNSFIERKKYSLCWHYRKSPELYASYQARKLTEELEFSLANLPAVVASGKKIVEAKAIEASKGAFVTWFTKHYLSNNGLVIAIGDDLTDEELFRSLRPTDISIKVGIEETKAKYRLREQREVEKFLLLFLEQLAT